MPSEALAGQPTAAMARVSINGRISVVKDMDEILSMRTAYAVTHTWSERLLESPKFAFWKLVPEKIYYVGGFGAGSEWVDVADYSTATSDILALEVCWEDMWLLLCSPLSGLAHVLWRAVRPPAVQCPGE